MEVGGNCGASVFVVSEVEVALAKSGVAVD